MTQQHTPVPWDVQNKGVLTKRSARHEIVQGINPDGSKNLPTIVRMPDLSHRSYANARFIVQACNAHDDLLAALEAGKGWLDSSLTAFNPLTARGNVERARDILAAAIARAKRGG